MAGERGLLVGECRTGQTWVARCRTHLTWRAPVPAERASEPFASVQRDLFCHSSTLLQRLLAVAVARLYPLIVLDSPSWVSSTATVQAPQPPSPHAIFTPCDHAICYGYKTYRYWSRGRSNKLYPLPKLEDLRTVHIANTLHVTILRYRSRAPSTSSSCG